MTEILKQHLDGIERSSGTVLTYTAARAIGFFGGAEARTRERTGAFPNTRSSASLQLVEHFCDSDNNRGYEGT